MSTSNASRAARNAAAKTSAAEKLAAANAAALARTASEARAVVWRALEAGVIKSRELMIDGLRVVCQHGQTTGAELREHAPTRFSSDKSAEVMASQFNTAHKSQMVIGQDATLGLIKSTVALGGTAWTLCLASLRSVANAGKDRPKDAPLATGKEGKRIVDAALSEAGRKLAEAQADAAALAEAAGKARAPKQPEAPLTHAAFVDKLTLLVAEGAKMDSPEARGTAWALMMNDLRKAVENGQAVKGRKPRGK